MSGGQGGEQGNVLEAQLKQLGLAAQDSGDIMQQLAAKYGCTSSSGGGNGAGAGGVCSNKADAGAGEDDEEYADVAPPGRPLAWFGSLVAPSLREAEAHFGEALALAVQAANAQRRLRSGLDGWQEQAAGAAAAADRGSGGDTGSTALA